MEWVKHDGKVRATVISEITANAIDFEDMDDHVWVVLINNRGSSLFCFGIAQNDDGWHTKMIAEDVGPDVYDCPRRLLDLSVTRNEQWRAQVMRHQGYQA